MNHRYLKDRILEGRLLILNNKHSDIGPSVLNNFLWLNQAHDISSLFTSDVTALFLFVSLKMNVLISKILIHNFRLIKRYGVF
jgi:hypothetical protein